MDHLGHEYPTTVLWRHNRPILAGKCCISSRCLCIQYLGLISMRYATSAHLGPMYMPKSHGIFCKVCWCIYMQNKRSFIFHCIFAWYLGLTQQVRARNVIKICRIHDKIIRYHVLKCFINLVSMSVLIAKDVWDKQLLVEVHHVVEKEVNTSFLCHIQETLASFVYNHCMHFPITVIPYRIHMSETI